MSKTWIEIRFLRTFLNNKNVFWDANDGLCLPFDETRRLNITKAIFIFMDLITIAFVMFKTSCTIYFSQYGNSKTWRYDHTI